MSKLMTIVAIAAVCHEANRALCAGLGDTSQPAWDESPDWQKESAIAGVEFNLTNPNVPASGSHDSWLTQKQNDGWKYGEVKDAELKTHPCFVPYEQLPKEQQAKDHLFKGIVAALAPIVDMTPQPAEEKKPQTFGSAIGKAEPVPAAEVAIQAQEELPAKAEPQEEAAQPAKVETAPASEQPKPLSKTAAKKAAKLAAAGEPHH